MQGDTDDHRYGMVSVHKGLRVFRLEEAKEVKHNRVCDCEWQLESLQEMAIHYFS